MNDQMFLSLGDPLRVRIIMEIQDKGQATASQLLAALEQVPQATLYRHLKKMLADGILKIASENPIRGTVEKVYALGYDLEGDIKKRLMENDGKLYLQMATQYILGILREFQEYADRQDIDITHDGSGFSVAPVYATQEELKEALARIAEVITALGSNPPDGKRQLRNLCIIATPPKSSKTGG